MKSEFAAASLTVGQLNAIVKKLGGHEGSLRFLRSKTPFIEQAWKWREQDGIIYFSVTSDGSSGSTWVARLENKGFQLDDIVKDMLCSKDFKPTLGVTTEIAVFKSTLFEQGDRTTENICAYAATEHQFSAPNAEVACLIREAFSDKEIVMMGLSSIVVMHKPIKKSVSEPRLFALGAKTGGSWLREACFLNHGSTWCPDVGFAFAHAQKLPAFQRWFS